MMEKISKELENLKNELSLNDEFYLQQMKEDYLKCPKAIKYLKDIGATEEAIDKYIVKVNDLVKDLNYCSKCPGIDKCAKTNPLVVTKLTYRYGIIDRELTPCKKVLEKAEIECRFKVRDFDDEWINIDLNNIDPSRERKEVLMKYKAYCMDTGDEWIYMTGSQNTGRSYLAAALAIDLAKKRKGPICYINSALRFKELNDLSYSDKRRYQELLDLYSTCQILIIDDFGSEFKNDFIRDAILMQIIIKRSGKKLFTIFTSDYTLSEIETLYSTTKIAKIQAERIVRTIKGECKKEINLGAVSVY